MADILVTNNALPKVLLFLTSHFSTSHTRFLQECWPHSIAKSLLLQHADVLVLSTGPHNLTILKEVFANNKLVIHDTPNPGYQAGAILALQLDVKHKWFNGYDWVIRLNPDVIIRNDTDILANIMNPDVDGIFVNCQRSLPPIIHTDWHAFRPSALPAEAFIEKKHNNAELDFTEQVHPILQSERFAWLAGAHPRRNGYCRMEGVVMHNHEYLDKCKSDLQG